MNPIIPLLQNEIGEIIAIMITGGKYEKNFYQGKLIEVNNTYIILEFPGESNEHFEFEHFILATPLERYH